MVYRSDGGDSALMRTKHPNQKKKKTKTRLITARMKKRMMKIRLITAMMKKRMKMKPGLVQSMEVFPVWIEMILTHNLKPKLILSVRLRAKTAYTWKRLSTRHYWQYITIVEGLDHNSSCSRKIWKTPS